MRRKVINLNLGDKTVRVNFRCSESMYEYLELQAHIRSISISDFLRSLVDQYRRAEDIATLLDSHGDTKAD